MIFTANTALAGFAPIASAALFTQHKSAYTGSILIGTRPKLEMSPRLNRVHISIYCAACIRALDRFELELSNVATNAIIPLLNFTMDSRAVYECMEHNGGIYKIEYFDVSALTIPPAAYDLTYYQYAASGSIVSASLSQPYTVS